MNDRTLLMIPGPIEFEPAVLAAMGAPTTSHLAPNFIEAFGQAPEKTRKVFLSDDGQPFVLAGSGTLAMDTAVANVIAPGGKALVVNTGFFSDRMGAILERYGAQVTHVKRPVGNRPALEEVEAILKQDQFKVMTITHVDTSAGKPSGGGQRSRWRKQAPVQAGRESFRILPFDVRSRANVPARIPSG